MQRKLETEIRKAKDEQMGYEKAGLEDYAIESQKKVNMLSKRYKELCNVSGLNPKPQRMRITGYKKRSTN